MLESSFGQCCWLLVTLIVAMSHCHSINASMDNCWTNEATCLVHATLHKSVSTELESGTGKSDTLPLDIDCATTQSADSTVPITASVKQPPDYLLKRFERAFGLTLNGCHKGLMWSTFGFEFLPNCAKITKTAVEQFHADVVYTLQCTGATFIQLEVLQFKHNEIAAITANSLSNLSLLRELYFVSNALRHIEENSFDNLHFVERIHFEDEPLLIIRDALLFKRTNLADLRLIGLKHVTSSLFENLPETLMNLTVSKTPIGDMRDAAASVDEYMDVGILYVNNPRLLRNVTITDCELNTFKMIDVHGSVLFLNLSGNRLSEFEILTNGTNATSELLLLDLSNNKLTDLPSQLLHPYMLQRLEKLYLQGNLLKQLPLMTFLSSFPAIKFIDLFANELEYLTVTNAPLESAILYQLRIRIDENPWNCKWVLDFAQAHPDKFRIFQYEKFLSQINVNGLACMPAETTYETTSAANVIANRSRVSDINASETYLNISTFTLIYGSPWDIKRNQRTEALIIVFMLPVGIAILFLLLYLWIYCQKVFHLSFYKRCPLLKRRRAQPQVTSPRFDVIRQLPPNNTTISMNNNDGYELPLNGVTPVCNCVHTAANSANNTPNLTNDKCRKAHHITYVPLPDGHAQQIYEEIIGNEEDACNDATEPARNIHPIYDHLTFH